MYGVPKMITLSGNFMHFLLTWVDGGGSGGIRTPSQRFRVSWFAINRHSQSCKKKYILQSSLKDYLELRLSAEDIVKIVGRVAKVVLKLENSIISACKMQKSGREFRAYNTILVNVFGYVEEMQEQPMYWVPVALI